MCHVVHHVVILVRVMLILEDPTTGTSDPTELDFQNFIGKRL
jgi:hypothetical protein